MTLKVGIDFGTSNSGVAICRDGQVSVLPVDEHATLPGVIKSILYITKQQEINIGQQAVELYYQQNVNRVRRFVRQWAGEIEVRGADMFYVTDVFVYVDEFKPGRLLQYLKTALRSGNYPGTDIFGRYYPLNELIAVYLAELKRRAEKLLGEKIDGVTLGRPVHFSTNPQLDRQAEDTLRTAALQAGFQQVDLEFEPVAAALWYERSLKRPENALIFDFGGGTLDITIMRLGDPAHRTVYASGGISIAGSDFDNAIIQKRMLTYFGLGKVNQEREILDLVLTVSDWSALPELSTPRAKAMLEKAIARGFAPIELLALKSLIFNDLAFSFYNAVESGKIALSSKGVVVIGLAEGEMDIWELYTRGQFEADIAGQQQQIEKVLLETLAASGLEPGEIDAVVKTGGSSSIPLFSGMLERIFGAEKVKASDTFSSVTAGLAVRAAG
jgi:hypothetical chaperone protein